MVNRCTETTGQVNLAIVWTVGVALIVFSFVGLVVGTTQERAETVAESATRPTVTQTLVNSTFTTDASVDWDNASSDNATTTWDNFNTSGDNAIFDLVGGENNAGAGENITFFQTLALGANQAVTAATLSGAYTVVRNDGTQNASTDNYYAIENIDIYVVLEDADGDNTTIVFADNAILQAATENAFTAFENDVLSTVTQAGNYTVYLQSIVGRIENAVAQESVIGWDNVQLSITVQNRSLAENLVDEAGTTSTDNFPLLGLVITITIVAAIILILRQVV